MNPTRLILGGVLAAASLYGADTAAIARGRRQFLAACAACHGADAQGGTGPDLRTIAGRKAGTFPGFRYSRALRTSGRIWTAPALDAFLADPAAAVPRNTMPYPGLPDPAARADLVAFLLQGK